MVYLYRVSDKIDEIKRICFQYHVLIVEDKSESFGVSYKGVQTGTLEDVNVITGITLLRWKYRILICDKYTKISG